MIVELSSRRNEQEASAIRDPFIIRSLVQVDAQEGASWHGAPPCAPISKPRIFSDGSRIARFANRLSGMTTVEAA